MHPSSRTHLTFPANTLGLIIMIYSKWTVLALCSVVITAEALITNPIGQTTAINLPGYVSPHIRWITY